MDIRKWQENLLYINKKYFRREVNIFGRKLSTLKEIEDF